MVEAAYWADAQQFEKLQEEAQAASETRVSGRFTTAGPEYNKSPVYLFFVWASPASLNNKQRPSILPHSYRDDKDFAEGSQLL